VRELAVACAARAIGVDPKSRLALRTHGGTAGLQAVGRDAHLLAGVVAESHRGDAGVAASAASVAVQTVVHALAALCAIQVVAWLALPSVTLPRHTARKAVAGTLCTRARYLALAWQTHRAGAIDLHGVVGTLFACGLRETDLVSCGGVAIVTLSCAPAPTGHTELVESVVFVATTAGQV